MAYEFSGKIEYEDFMKFNRTHMRRLFLSGKKPLLWIFLSAILLLISISDGYDIAVHGRPFTDTSLFFIIIVCVVYAMLFLVLPKFRYRKLFNSNRLLQEKQTFTVSELNIAISSPSISVQITRDKIEKLVCTADLICIYISRMQAYLIPRRYFDDDAEFADISAFIKMHFDPQGSDR